MVPTSSRWLPRHRGWRCPRYHSGDGSPRRRLHHRGGDTSRYGMPTSPPLALRAITAPPTSSRSVTLTSPRRRVTTAGDASIIAGNAPHLCGGATSPRRHPRHHGASVRCLGGSSIVTATRSYYHSLHEAGDLTALPASSWGGARRHGDARIPAGASEGKAGFAGPRETRPLPPHPASPQTSRAGRLSRFPRPLSPLEIFKIPSYDSVGITMIILGCQTFFSKSFFPSDLKRNENIFVGP